MLCERDQEGGCVLCKKDQGGGEACERDEGGGCYARETRGGCVCVLYERVSEIGLRKI